MSVSGSDFPLSLSKRRRFSCLCPGGGGFPLSVIHRRRFPSLCLCSPLSVSGADLTFSLSQAESLCVKEAHYYEPHMGLTFVNQSLILYF